jgi:FlaA1/EpsC-like NDP-sugar epimerase
MNKRHIDVWLERICQVTAVGLSLILAFNLRFDFAIPSTLVPALRNALILAILVKLLVFDWAGFYRSLRRFVSIPDLYLVFLGNAIGSVVFAGAAMFWFGRDIPVSIFAIDAVICFVATALVRFSVRLCNEAFREHSGQARIGILIYGAGAAGAELVREIHSNRCTHYAVQGFIDDDPLKQDAVILGIPVLGTGRDAFSIVQRLNRRHSTVEEIIIAMRSATGQQMRETLANCRAARIPCKTVPGIDELLGGTILTAQVRNLSVNDLLGRQPVKLDEAPVRSSINGRCVLVTGAAGSIGSELCRQVARLNPSYLVALDQAESELFRIEGELREKHPGLEMVAALGDIRDPDRLHEILERHHVERIFHAAAYKHVPMMESHVVEAVRNNILGTWNLVNVARKSGVRSLLMISSDKAVNPICVMGATKRVCERIVTAQRTGASATRCSSVRFGNVLGSNGSVVPIFQAQIAAGGPIKVTHPHARRYFMTISEAVSLTLQASSKSHGSEIFVLDMGEPVRIVDLAENMIRLAGLVPYDDIDIQFTGLRPGEKLMEEINGKGEGIHATDQEKMQVISDPPLSWEVIPKWIEELEDLLTSRSGPNIIEHLQRLVPEYIPSSKLCPAREPGLAGRPASVFSAAGSRNGNGNGKSNGAHGHKSQNASGSPIACEQ